VVCTASVRLIRKKETGGQPPEILQNKPILPILPILSDLERGPDQDKHGTMPKDYYRVLGVARDAEPIVIRAAFRALAKRYHPDTGIKDDKKFREINEAHEVLSDAERRAEYDLLNQTAYEQSASPAPQTPTKGTLDKAQRISASVGLILIGIVALLSLLTLYVHSYVHDGGSNVTTPPALTPGSPSMGHGNQDPLGRFPELTKPR
jgi:DnaJ-like protein